ncbi:hypothetical protein ACEPAG_3992 [Sanghuangporus baumii]
MVEGAHYTRHWELPDKPPVFLDFAISEFLRDVGVDDAISSEPVKDTSAPMATTQTWLHEAMSNPRNSEKELAEIPHMYLCSSCLSKIIFKSMPTVRLGLISLTNGRRLPGDGRFYLREATYREVRLPEIRLHVDADRLKFGIRLLCLEREPEMECSMHILGPHYSYVVNGHRDGSWIGPKAIVKQNRPPERMGISSNAFASDYRRKLEDIYLRGHTARSDVDGAKEQGKQR